MPSAWKAKENLVSSFLGFLTLPLFQALHLAYCKIQIFRMLQGLRKAVVKLQFNCSIKINKGSVRTKHFLELWVEIQEYVRVFVYLQE